MFIKKGKTNWAMVISVAVIAGAAGGLSVLYINDTIQQTMMLSQSGELRTFPRNTTMQVPEMNTIQNNGNVQNGIPAANGVQMPVSNGAGAPVPAANGAAQQ